MMRNQLPSLIVVLGATQLPGLVSGAEFVVLNEATWDAFAAVGKEADCIYGDYVLRTGGLVAAIGDAVPTRNANMRLRGVGGCLIDLTERDRPNDQFGALYPAPERQLRFREVRVDGKDTNVESGAPLSGKIIELVFDAVAPDGVPLQASCRVTYRVDDDVDGLAIINEYGNPTDQPLTVTLEDAVRVDFEATWSADVDARLFCASDVFWGQSYCVMPENASLTVLEPNDERSGPSLRYGANEGAVSLAPGETVSITRRVFPAAHEITARAKALRSANKELHGFELSVRDAAGPVAGAIVTVKHGEQIIGVALTPASGKLEIQVPRDSHQAVIRHHARGEATVELDPNGSAAVVADLPTCGYVTGKVTTDAGDPVACKVDFEPLDGGAAPDFGPDSAEYGVRNLIYTPDGTFHAEVRPGKFRILVSHGPEFDAVPLEIAVAAGLTSNVEAALAHSVDTTGWISADFHSHSSPSGDNAASQLGRVLNLLAEHIEFAPCTEHNRITNYLPHLKTLSALERMATCAGMELTGQPLPLNHQNAFPLVEHVHTQDGGGPTTHPDPVVQIERLAMWDNASDKLVQTNHPDLVQMLGDKDQDGQADGGFEGMFGFMDVVEVHPPEQIFQSPEEIAARPTREQRLNTIVNWMQLLNFGYRVPGVVNTDAHWNYHGSGPLRNFIRSSTDDPSQVDVMDLVHDSEHGHIVMSNGPFLEVTGSSIDNPYDALPGDAYRAAQNKVTLHVRVQCPNWLDVNLVQIFVNGRADERYRFTRRTHPLMFADGVVKFDQKIAVELTADAHLIVAVGNEGGTLGRVYGPDAGLALPTAVANPIFVDVEGNGFQSNGDDLGLPLPIESGHLPSQGAAAAAE
jgi:hypothetical protein